MIENGANRGTKANGKPESVWKRRGWRGGGAGERWSNEDKIRK